MNVKWFLGGMSNQMREPARTIADDGVDMNVNSI